jgi:GH43 family beta-xylosidase
MTAPAHDRAFADPFVFTANGRFLAVGTEDPAPDEGPVFPMLVRDAVHSWREIGRVLERPSPELGSSFWAPEIAEAHGRWWLYYSVGHDIHGHHVRVAVATDVTGPYLDTGAVLTPGERFAIDPHPFRDVDGRTYLFFARDVLEAERPGTHLAVVPLSSPDRAAGDPVAVLAPFADWQIYRRARPMYGGRYDWHTLEGPFVVRRRGRYWMTFSGGAWTGDGYAVSWAVADHPLGPWTPAPTEAPPLLASGDGLIGPGHNSVFAGPDGDFIAFHSWDAEHTARRMHVRRITFERDGPRVTDPPGDGPPAPSSRASPRG